MISGLPSSRLTIRLRCIVDLSAAAERLIGQLPITVKNYAANEIIVAQGATPANCCLVLEGFTAREKTAAAFDRQIIAFYVPGDIPDAATLHLPKMDHNLIAIGRAVVGFIPHQALISLLAQSAELLHAFWRETLIDSALLRQAVVNLGRQEGIARIAHLLCELAMRLDAVGLLRERTLPIPWTQVDVAAATGMSAIHANRVIQELRAQGLVEWGGGHVRILDWERLREAAGFVPDYLHLKRPGSSLSTPSAEV